MERVESEIKRVLHDFQWITSSVRSEEANIDGLTTEIKLLEDRVQVEWSELDDLERQRMQNLVSYQSTLITRAESRTELLRALQEDLLALFTRRKQLRCYDDAGGSSVDAMPNVSLSSRLSIGDDENQEFPQNCSTLGSMPRMKMTAHENLAEETTTDQQHIPFVKLLQLNMNENACLTPEDGSDYGDLQYKDDILDNIALSILDSNGNIDSIFKEAMNSNVPCEESEGFENVDKKMGCPTSCNSARQMTVDFDDIGNPTGPNAGAFKKSINSYVCQHLPIRFKQIGEIPVEDYKSVVNALTENYSFDMSRSYTRKKISSCYRQHKYKLLVQVKKDLERGLGPRKPSYINEEDWIAFVAKTRDEEFDKISKKNKVSRSQLSALNRKGMSSAVRKRKLKGSEQGQDNSIWSKVNKLTQGKLLDSKNCLF